jgi:hypothetical protein
MSNEAVITINGTVLTVGQSLAVRVACQSELDHLEDPEYLGSDDDGVKLTEEYRRRLKEVLSLIARPVADDVLIDAGGELYQPMTEGQREAAAEITGNRNRL